MEHNPKLELETAHENVRHYENIFFAHLTVFITVTAGLAAIAFQPLTSDAKIVLIAKALGLLFGVSAWVNATIFLDRAYRLIARIVTLERQLGFQLYSGFPEHLITLFSKFRWLRPGGLAWHLLYGAVAAFWAASMLKQL